ncbi:hypothetical protein CJ030_MR2G028737 [Morella rubra]|uniref:C2H2-type domain-containing protein n=1 Tax=Morella rubra TaxID=262757 RepID=A0A6A1WAX9_9ROSI|nr:hypothetical protein CJ030_MR2G028737 [Morella rubra]
MENDISSEESSTAASGPMIFSYTCPHCFKVFGSGQALGGHQTAHRTNRVVRRITKFKRPKRYNPTLQPPHPENVQPRPDGPGLVQRGPGSMADLGDSWVPQLQLVAGSAALREYHSNLRPAPEDSPQSLTRDYFAEWIRPTYHVKRAGEDSEIRSSERTIFDPINLRISMGGQDREEGNSKKEANLDLNLKLGF